MQQLQDYINQRLQVIDRVKNELYPRATAFIKRYIAWLGLLAVSTIMATIYFMQPASQPKVQGISISTQTASSSAIAQQAASIKVDVSGAVNQPGVKLLQDGDRVEDALRAADGLSDKVDTVYVATTINLAAKVKDGDKIFIPSIGQNTDSAANTNNQSSQSNATATSANPGKMSINQASDSQLDTLPGVGATYVGRIIAGRPYSSIDDFCSRNIFRSKSTCDKIRPLITL